MASKNTVKEWFKTGLKPTQSQFWSFFDSIFWKDETIPITAIEDIADILNAKAEESVLTNHLTDANAHSELFAEFVSIDVVNELTPKGGFTGTSQQLNNRLTVVENPDRVLKFGTITMTGLTASIVANDYQWRLSQNTFLATPLFSQLMVAAAAGKYRNNIVVGTTTGDYQIIQGAEASTGAGASEPGVPADTIKLGFILLFGATVSASGNAPSVEKLTIVDNDRIRISDSADSYKEKEVKTITVKDKFFSGELRFPNYPNTRNDGQLPMNKVLSVDLTGNVKLYGIATAPAPYMQILIPSSNLPSTTGNFIIKGSFFTPSTTVAIAGQVVNYVTFISDNEIRANVTTGSATGYFAVTLNNGISAVFNNALLIVLGTVFEPLASDWVTSGQVDVTQGTNVLSKVYGSQGLATWSKDIDYTKNFRIEFSFGKSPLGQINKYPSTTLFLSLIKKSTSENIVSFNPYLDYSQSRWGIGLKENTGSTNAYWAYANVGSLQAAYDTLASTTISLRWVSGVMYIYLNNVLKTTLAGTIAELGAVKVSVDKYDFINIKYIETP